MCTKFLCPLSWFSLTDHWTNNGDIEPMFVWQASQQQCLPQHRLLVAASEDEMQPRARVSSPAWCKWQSDEVFSPLGWLVQCVCVCDISEQRGPHISSVSATQGPGLLGWRSDADAHLPCHRRPESSRPSGHLAVLQPSSLRSQQHNMHLLEDSVRVTVDCNSV